MDKNKFSEDAKKLITGIDGDLETLDKMKPADFKNYINMQKQLDESYKIKVIIDAWKEQQEADRKLRDKYALWLIIFLGFQLIFISVLMVFIGLAKLEYDQWLIKIFISSVFAEIVGMVYVIVRYLFTPTNNSEINKLIEKL